METRLTEQEIDQLRAETKGTAGLIHFNNAGSALPPDVVVDTVISYLQEEAINGGYETEAKYKSESNPEGWGPPGGLPSGQEGEGEVKGEALMIKT